MVDALNSDGWRPSSIVHESLLNIRARSSHTIPAIIALTVLFGAISLVELVTTDEILSFHEFRIEEGAFVVVAFREEGVVNAADCSRVATAPHVLHAGGYRNADRFMFAKAPGTMFRRVMATGQIRSLWASNADSVASQSWTDGLVVGDAVAREIGLGNDSFVTTDHGVVREVHAVVDTSRRNPSANRWVIDRAAPIGGLDECWVEFSVGGFEAGRMALASQFKQDGSPISTRTLTAQGSLARDPIAEFGRRPGRWIWLGTGLAGALVMWVLAIRRRSEIGLYRALGMSISGLLLGASIEASVVVFIAGLISLGWTIISYDLVVGIHPDQVAVVIHTTISSILLAWALGPLGQLAVIRNQVAYLLKDHG